MGRVRIILQPELGHLGGQETGDNRPPLFQQNSHTSLSLGACQVLIKCPLELSIGQTVKIISNTWHFTKAFSHLLPLTSSPTTPTLAPATLASLLFNKHARHSASGPLLWPFPVPECFPLQICMTQSLTSLPFKPAPMSPSQEGLPQPPYLTAISLRSPEPISTMPALISPITMITFDYIPYLPT